ncbi:hypothetical protein [Mesorhizobium sp. GbtcB19]|uniref:hypothetical protein n=1 Tax=Mesorhizobium sp. GbtcB19 TaxID=2824764 RepID=UPI001C307E38|nr:hypothetical protein [Mesorhizobium sp. GbtcB19]
MERSSHSRWCSFVRGETLSTCSWKPRKWITCLQDHYLAGDEPFWQANQNSGPVHAVREALWSVREAINYDETSTELKDELSLDVSRVEQQFANLEADTSALFRLFWLVWVIPFIAWTLYLAIFLEEWGQLIGQSAVLSRTLSLGVAVLRYRKSTGWIIFKFYEDRVLGSLPALIFYTIASRPAYRHLHGDWRYTTLVGCVTCLGLLLLSYWQDLWVGALFLRSKLWLAPPILTRDLRVKLRTARNTLLESVKELQHCIEDADISDRMKDHLLMVKRDADRLLRTIKRILPIEDAAEEPRYPRMPKVPVVVLTAVLQAPILGASYRYPWLMAESAGWGIWNTIRMMFGLIASYVSQGDIARRFSNIVAGGLALLPLTLAILFTNGAVLLPVENRVLLAVGLILIVNAFSNLAGTFCKGLSKRTQCSQGDIGQVGRIQTKMHSVLPLVPAKPLVFATGI